MIVNLLGLDDVNSLLGIQSCGHYFLVLFGSVAF